MIGIDLGTTNSLCALFRDGAPLLIPNAQGEVLTPSLVGLLPSGEVVVGQAARELRVTQPEAVAACFKRWIGLDKSVVLRGKTFTAPELSALVLKSLKADAEAFLGEALFEVVVTVPAYFNDDQRQATRLAGELAGLRVRRMLNEPTAAALTYGYQDGEGERKLLVFDLGGGTFDVSLMEVFEGSLEIVATAGECALGGEDFTERLLGWALREQGLQLETTEMREPLRVARLREACEAAKRELSQEDEVELKLPTAEGSYDPEPPRLSLSRETLRGLSKSLIEGLKRPLLRVLRDAETEPAEVDQVILVGGATRMILVSELVREVFGREPLCEQDPDEVVALGAAVQAALIDADRAVEDLVLTDVCPHTLGVEVVKSYGREHRDGYFMPVIPRNTTIPVSREEVVSTLRPNQTGMTIEIYQGEARRVKGNLKLGELEVKGLPPGPAGTPVHLRFTYDLSGVLEVEAYVPDTGKRFRTLITRTAKGLSEREIKRAQARMKALKFYPRDELCNRELGLYAERIVGEVAPVLREELEQALDLYEHALRAGDPELFGAARQALLLTLTRLGFPHEGSS